MDLRAPAPTAVEGAAQTTSASKDARRNPGLPLTLQLFEGHSVNRSAALRRSATQVKNIWIPDGE